MILKPSPPNIQELYLESLVRLGIDPMLHDIRFVEDDWESPTLGAWGLGWEVWCDGMEVSQFTYFQQVGGFDCDPVAGELTYGLERLAMYIQGVDSIYDLNYNGRDDDKRVLYRDVFKQAEEEYSRHNFEFADTAMLLQRFRDAEKECKALLAAGEPKSEQRAPSAGAAGLRPVHQGEPHLQSAGRARRHLRHRAAELYSARARSGEGVLRRLAKNRGGRGIGLFAEPVAKKRPDHVGNDAGHVRAEKREVVAKLCHFLLHVQQDVFVLGDFSKDVPRHKLLAFGIFLEKRDAPFQIRDVLLDTHDFLPTLTGDSWQFWHNPALHL